MSFTAKIKKALGSRVPSRGAGSLEELSPAEPRYSGASADELIQQYQIIHSTKPNYGRSSERLLNSIQLHIEELGTVSSILDYGCGRSRTVDWLGKLNDAKAYRYDPAIPEFNSLPVQEADLVINTDVLEHVPEDALDDVLSKISAISKNVYFQVATDEAHTTLPNGENAHCTVRPTKWWLQTLNKHFKYVRNANPNLENRAAFVTWRIEAETQRLNLASYLEYSSELSGEDCIVIGSAPEPSLEGIDTSSKKIICCNGSALTLHEQFGLKPDFTFIHSHVPWRINNPADKDVRDALSRVDDLGKLVILFHPKHTYDASAYSHQTTATFELMWEARYEVIRRLIGSSVTNLDLSTGATAVAAVALAGARSITLVGFSLANKGHSYNANGFHRAHVSSDAALYTLLHASGFDISATDPSLKGILTKTVT